MARIVAITNWPEKRVKPNMLTTMSRLKKFTRCSVLGTSSSLHMSPTCEVSGDGAGPSMSGSALQKSEPQATCQHIVEVDGAKATKVIVLQQRVLKTVDASTFTNSASFAPKVQLPAPTTCTSQAAVIEPLCRMSSPDNFNQAVLDFDFDFDFDFVFDVEDFDELLKFEDVSKLSCEEFLASPIHMDQDLHTFHDRCREPFIDNFFSRRGEMALELNKSSNKRNRAPLNSEMIVKKTRMKSPFST